MLKSETVRARVNPELKQDVELVLDTLGLNMSDAIVLFLSQIRLQQGLPFHVRIPNDLTQKTLANTDQGQDLHQAKDVDDLFDQIGV